MAKKKAPTTPPPPAQELSEHPQNPNSTLNYADVPTVQRLMAVIEQMPRVPDRWQEIALYQQQLDQWREELREAARFAAAAANDATGLMCEIIDGKKTLDSGASHFLAMAIAIRA